MRLVVTGASSFVGAHFCRRAAHRHEVVAVYHRTPVSLNRVTPVRIDLRHQQAPAKLAALEPDAIVHIAGRVMGASTKPSVVAGNRRMLDAVLAVGVPVLYASSTVVHWEQATAYGDWRKEDEARVAAAGVPWAIVRPCAPYGPRLREHQPGHKESFQALADMVRSWPVVPLPGSGKALRQPIHVEDLADAMLALLERGLPNQAFDAGGAECMTLDEVVGVIAAAAGTSPVRLHLPAGLLGLVARYAPDLDEELMGTADTDDPADPSALQAASGVRLRGFSEGVRCLL